MLTMGSLFDDIGGFVLAGQRHGITTLWASEIEAFPIAVTKHHFPGMLHVGDITLLDGAKLPPVDIICGGSPCQDLSVAGRRAGLTGERSGLFMEQIRIIRPAIKSQSLNTPPDKKNIMININDERNLMKQNYTLYLVAEEEPLETYQVDDGETFEEACLKNDIIPFDQIENSNIL